MVKSKPPPVKCGTTITTAQAGKVSRLDPSPPASLPSCPPATSTMEVDPPSHASAMEVESPPAPSGPSDMELDVSVPTSPPASLPTQALPASRTSTPGPSASQASSQYCRYGPDPRNHLLYFDLVVPNAPTVGSDMVASYHLSLIRVVEELYKVDNTISLFPYGKLDSNKSLILKMGSSLGDTLSQLSTYFDGLRLTRDAYPPLFVSILLGFDSDDDLITPNCQAQLNAIGTRISL